MSAVKIASCAFHLVIYQALGTTEQNITGLNLTIFRNILQKTLDTHYKLRFSRRIVVP